MKEIRTLYIQYDEPNEGHLTSGHAFCHNNVPLEKQTEHDGDIWIRPREDEDWCDFKAWYHAVGWGYSPGGTLDECLERLSFDGYIYKNYQYIQAKDKQAIHVSFFPGTNLVKEERCDGTRSDTE